VIVGRCGDHWESQIFRWTREGGMTGLGMGRATGISGDGSVIVGYSRGFRSAMQGFVWREQTGMAPFPGGTETCVPWGASFDGSSIIGGGCDYADGTHGYGFIWSSSSGLRDIDRLLSSLGGDTGDRHFIPLAISDDGRTLAGRILSPATGYAGWIARLPRSLERKPAEQGPLPRAEVPGPRARSLGPALVGGIATGVAAVLLWYYLMLASMSVSLAWASAARVGDRRRPGRS
jgi:hypothetical protein